MTENKESKVKDGLYLFYVKNETMYPVALNGEDWERLQMLGNTMSGPIRVIDEPLGVEVNKGGYSV